MSFNIICLRLLYLIGTILVALLCLLLCYMFYLHYLHNQYAHLPGPERSSFIFGNLVEIWRYKKATGRLLTEYVTDLRMEHGPVFLMFLMHIAVVYIADPSYVREVFVNKHKYLVKPSFLYDKLGFVYGERGMGRGILTNVDETLWQKRRHLMNPAFNRKCLKEFMMNFNAVSNRFLVRMNQIAQCGDAVSMVQEFAKVTLEVISQVSFNINTNAIEDPDSPFRLAVLDYLEGVQTSLEFPLNNFFLRIFQFYVFQKGSHRVQINAVRFLRQFASDCIDARRKDISEHKDVPNDLLNLLINDDELTRDDIIDEFITIFIAGQETTANSLGFTLYEILSNPDVEAKLCDEIKEVLGERESVEYGDLAKLKYTGQIMNESLRLHPITSTPSRTLTKEIMIGGYRIPKGTEVTTFPYMFSLDPNIWKEPEVFDPERFADPESIPNLSMVHFPFSVGPRNCLGQTLAKFEFKVILAKLFQNFQFKLLPNQTGRMKGRLTLTPRDGVMCKVSQRVQMPVKE